MSAPNQIDLDLNRTVDFVYAGDLQGNLWKFDLSSTSASSWGVALGGAPLFIATDAAGNRQPITAAPQFGPPLANVGGVMLYFGTGRMFAPLDAISTQTQSFYGIADTGSAVTGSRSTALQSETITPSVVNGKNVRSVSMNAVTPPQRGYFLDLPASGERIVFPALVDLNTGVVLFSTIIPNGDPCNGGGISFLMALSSGGNQVGGAMFFNQAGLVPATVKTSVDGMQFAGLIKSVISMSNTGSGSGGGTTGTGMGGGTQTFEVTTDSGTTPINVPRTVVRGRVSWHELVR
jgi:type IV pilus assembly protein PilY1